MSNEQNELFVINQEAIKEMIYEIRGQKVMMDFDLAKIYGYETRRFNEQVKNNIDRFDDDFMFQITKEEFETILKSKKSTSSWGGRRKEPYVFTEQGIYMLMTVLKGDLAIQQSKSLIRLFKAMKDYIIETKNVSYSANQCIDIKFSSYDKRFEIIENKLNMVMDNFIDPSTYKEFAIFDGQRIESDIAFQTIYSLAKKSIILIDDYISVKTLQLFKVCRNNIIISVCSDNVARNGVTDELLQDFINDTGLIISLKPTYRKAHDRYIVIDYETDNEIIYHSGCSSKDGGNKLTTIMRIENNIDYHRFIDDII